MKRIVLLWGVLTLAACGPVSQPADNTLRQLDVAHYQGRWLVVNYWAQWCTPCIKEIPELNALHSAYPQVAVLGVNFDGATGDELQAQIGKLGIDFPILLQDPAAQLGLQRPTVLPTTLILDPDGTVVHTLTGPQTLNSLALATGQAGIPEAGPRAEDLTEE